MIQVVKHYPNTEAVFSRELLELGPSDDTLPVVGDTDMVVREVEQLGDGRMRMTLTITADAVSFDVFAPDFSTRDTFPVSRYHAG